MQINSPGITTCVVTSEHICRNGKVKGRKKKTTLAMTSTVSIPQFLLPRGISQRTLRYAAATVTYASSTSAREVIGRCAFSSSSWRKSSSSSSEEGKPRVLAQPDRFRPPSHPARRVIPTRNGKLVDAAPFNYPGPPLSEKEKEEMKKKRYPNMFPPEGTFQHKFLTSRWIHAWIAMVLFAHNVYIGFIENIF